MCDRDEKRGIEEYTDSFYSGGRVIMIKHGWEKRTSFVVHGYRNLNLIELNGISSK